MPREVFSVQRVDLVYNGTCTFWESSSWDVYSPSKNPVLLTIYEGKETRSTKSTVS